MDYPLNHLVSQRCNSYRMLLRFQVSSLLIISLLFSNIKIHQLKRVWWTSNDCSYFCYWWLHVSILEEVFFFCREHKILDTTAVYFITSLLLEKMPSYIYIIRYIYCCLFKSNHIYSGVGNTCKLNVWDTHCCWAIYFFSTFW